MNWLVDADLLRIRAPEDFPPSPAAQSFDGAESIPIHENGEHLESVRDRFLTLPIYSWLGLRLAPSQLRLREHVLNQLIRADAALPVEFSLVIIDAWRPGTFQAELLEYYRAATDSSVAGFVSDPGGALVAPHTTGGAVDLTLGWRGAVLGLGTDFDEFSPAAAINGIEDEPDRTATRLRRMLSAVLSDAGFAPYPLEWWHWSYGDQIWAHTRGEPAAIYGAVE